MADDLIAFVPIVLIIWAISLVTFIVVRGMSWKHREKQLAALQGEQQVLLQQAGPTSDQVQMLEDRVRVLERIVTDQSSGLARDIEALRERRQSQEEI